MRCSRRSGAGALSPRLWREKRRMMRRKTSTNDQTPPEVMQTPQQAMSEEQLHRLAAYVRLIADRMHLRDWRFVVSAEPAEPGNHASITCAEKRKVACIQFAANFFE